MLQQCLLCKGGRHNLDGDKLPRSGLPVWCGIWIECNSSYIHFLLLPPAKWDAVFGNPTVASSLKGQAQLLHFWGGIKQLSPQAASRLIYKIQFCAIHPTFLQSFLVESILNVSILPVLVQMGNPKPSCWFYPKFCLFVSRLIGLSGLKSDKIGICYGFYLR